MKLPLRGLSFHDLHLLHNNVPTKDIIDRFVKQLNDRLLYREQDVIILAGDVFDQLTYFNDPDVTLVNNWIRWLLRLCKERNIVLLVVEGTPSHDAKQSRHFVDNNQDIQASLYYVDEIKVVYVKELQANVLFVPDQMGTPEVVFGKVMSEYKRAGIEKADFAVHHGQFSHQFPAFLKISCLPSEVWADLTYYGIFTGHIHNRSQFGNIYGAGSFDRLKHGEEQPKGFFSFLFTEFCSEVDWIENPDATLFKTIDVSHQDFDKAIENIKSLAESLPDHSFMRILVSQDDAIREGLQTIRKSYPLLHVTVETKKENEEKVVETFEVVEEEFVPIEINQNNLISLAREEIRVKYPLLSESEQEATLILLAETLGIDYESI